MPNPTHSRLLFALPAIFLLGASAPSSPQQQSNISEISITGSSYDPASLTVTVGTRIRWTNKDTRDHTVAADNKAFDSGNISPGATYTWTPAKPGTYDYGCSYHPRMRGSITVKN